MNQHKYLASPSLAALFFACIFSNGCDRITNLNFPYPSTDSGMDGPPEDTDTTGTDTETETSTSTVPFDGGNRDAGNNEDGGILKDDSGIREFPDAGDSGTDGSAGPPFIKTQCG